MKELSCGWRPSFQNRQTEMKFEKFGIPDRVWIQKLDPVASLFLLANQSYRKTLAALFVVRGEESECEGKQQF